MTTIEIFKNNVIIKQEPKDAIVLTCKDSVEAEKLQDIIFLKTENVIYAEVKNETE